MAYEYSNNSMTDTRASRKATEQKGKQKSLAMITTAKNI